MAARTDAIFVSLRDPRDAVTSMVQHMGDEFCHSIAARRKSRRHFAARHAGDARAKLFIYESGFTDAEPTFDLLAKALGGTLTAAQRGKTIRGDTAEQNRGKNFHGLRICPPPGATCQGRFAGPRHAMAPPPCRAQRRNRALARLLPPQDALQVERRLADSCGNSAIRARAADKSTPRLFLYMVCDAAAQRPANCRASVKTP